MKAVFVAEAIGLGLQQETDAMHMIGAAMTAAVGVPGVLGPKPPSMKPWLAEITGRDPKYGLARDFVKPKVDYRESSSTANRGVYYCWTLETGRVYEARYRTSWNSGFHRPFLRVTDDGDVVEISREEVEAWLSEGSASTS